MSRLPRYMEYGVRVSLAEWCAQQDAARRIMTEQMRQTPAKYPDAVVFQDEIQIPVSQADLAELEARVTANAFRHTHSEISTVWAKKTPEEILADIRYAIDKFKEG